MATRAITKLERRYARALLIAVERELGRDGSPSPAQKISSELQGVAYAWEHEHLLSNALLNPMFEKGEREQALVKLLQKSGASSVLVRFLQVCFERDRLDIVPGIAAAFQDEAQRAAGIVPVEITTAKDLGRDEQKMVESSLASSIRGSLRFSWFVDGSLLGGMVIRYHGKVVDGSVSGRLAQIQRRLEA